MQTKTPPVRASLAPYNELVASELKFLIEGPVPTTADIEARLAYLSCDRLEMLAQAARTNRMTGVSCFGLGGLVGFGLMGYLSSVYPAGAYFVGAISVIAGWTIGGRFCQAGRDYAKARDRMEFESCNLEPLPQYQCSEMLIACQATPEGNAYRTQVAAMTREFVMAEFRLICHWASGHRSREATRELYAPASI